MTDNQFMLVLDSLRQLREDINDRLERVESQVAKTNGRVTKLELAKAFGQGVRHAYKWVPPVATGVFCVGITAAVSILLHHLGVS